MTHRPLALCTNFRYQLLIGLSLALWLYLFLALVGPFDASTVSLRDRVSMMIGYGLVFFGTYTLLIPLQNWWYHKKGGWTLADEVGTLLFFTVYTLPATFAYYKTDIVRGDFNFNYFSLTVYLPIIVILLPVILVSRYLMARRQVKEVQIGPTAEKKWLTLSGTNKLDVLRIAQTDLLALTAANNYVAVHYLEAGQLKKKLLRNTLSKMAEELPELLRVHRSYLINPHHFLEWKDSQNMKITQMVIPVSPKYKAAVLEHALFRP